jgi:putative ABC transport system permease protein
VEEVSGALVARGLVRRFGARRVLDALDLDVAPGELVGVAGPSGAGKTTLLRALAWLEPLDAGEVRLAGQTPAELGVPQWRARVAYVAQRPAVLAQTPRATARARRQLGTAQSRERSDGRGDPVAIAARWGVGETLWDQPWAELSGGEQQRVALALTLARRPVVVLLDEPTAALDPASASAVEADLIGLTGVLVTHDEALRGPLPITALDLALAASLICVHGALSLALGLGIERRLLVAAARSVVQLLLVGVVLVRVFAWSHPVPVLALCAVMVALATQAAVKRSSRTARGVPLAALLALVLAAGSTAAIGTGAILGVDPWWTPQYLVPLVGMILDDGRAAVDATLAAGGTWWEASRPVVQDALRTGMIPILNTMSVAGVVTLPGMMTGQILGGTDPALAARYQIVILFLIAAATAIGAAGAVLGATRLAFDDEHRLRPERIIRRP